jgi:hypothetical protein
MPFFLKTKTIREVNIYFNSLSLDELIDWNKRYGNHIVDIEARKERAENELTIQKEKLATYQNKYQLLLSQENDALAEEEKKCQEIAGIEYTGSRSEGYLLKAQLHSYSPLDCYWNNVMAQQDAIRTTTQLIQRLESRIESAKNDISLTVQELKILNRIIEEQRNTLKTEELAGSSSAGYSRPYNP